MQLPWDWDVNEISFSNLFQDLTNEPPKYPSLKSCDNEHEALKLSLSSSPNTLSFGVTSFLNPLFKQILSVSWVLQYL